jgi:hypothetical protein
MFFIFIGFWNLPNKRDAKGKSKEKHGGIRHPKQTI